MAWSPTSWSDSGSAIAKLDSTASLLLETVRAIATGDGSRTSHARVGPGPIDPALALGANAAAFAVALPDAAAATALAGNDDALVRWNAPAANDIFALALLGGGGSPGDLQVSPSNQIDLVVDPNEIATPADLVVSFLDPIFEGDGFQSLSLTIEREGQTVLTRSWTDLASALGFFDDGTLDLGDWTIGLAGDLDISVALSLDAVGADPSFFVDFVVGNSPTITPEPGTAVLLGIGLAVLARRRRHT